MTLVWSKTTVPVNAAIFRPDHSLVEHPGVPHAVIDTNDSTATCDYNHCTAGCTVIGVIHNVNIVNNTSSRLLVKCGNA